MLVQRWWQSVKLARGRCYSCGEILRDDNATGFCDQECYLDWQADAAI